TRSAIASFEFGVRRSRSPCVTQQKHPFSTSLRFNSACKDLTSYGSLLKSPNATRMREAVRRREASCLHRPKRVL
ncbi:MAG: hypothetical protein ACK56I_17500, partial [bacterium]